MISRVFRFLSHRCPARFLEDLSMCTDHANNFEFLLFSCDKFKHVVWCSATQIVFIVFTFQKLSQAASETSNRGDLKNRVRLFQRLQKSRGGLRDLTNQVRRSRRPQKSRGGLRDITNRVRRSCNMDLWFDTSSKGKQCLGKTASSLIGHLAFASRWRVAVLNTLSQCSV